MPFFPDVKKGEKFKPNALLENSVRRIVNGGVSISGGKITGSSSVGKIAVYNKSDQILSKGSAVSFFGSYGSDKIVPCKPFSGHPCGILTSTLKPNTAGSCVVSGPVEVELSDSDIDSGFVVPVLDNPAKFIKSRYGFVILSENEYKKTALIDLNQQSGVIISSHIVLPENVQIKSVSCSNNITVVNIKSYIETPLERKELEFTLSTATPGTYCLAAVADNKMVDAGTDANVELKLLTAAEYAALDGYKIRMAMFDVTENKIELTELTALPVFHAYAPFPLNASESGE